MTVHNQLVDAEAAAYQGTGTVLIAPVDKATDQVIGPFQHIGYVDTLDLSASPTEISLQNAAKGSNVTVASSITEIEVTFDMTIRDFRPENLEKMLYGNLSTVTSETGKTKVMTVNPGGIYELDGIVAEGGTVTVEDSSAASLVEGTDYTIERTGAINILEGGNVGADEEITVTYDTVETQKIEGFTEDVIYLKVRIQGVNNATGKYFNTQFHKAQLNPADGLGFLSPNDYGETSMSGTLIASKAISGTGLSQILTHTSE